MCSFRLASGSHQSLPSPCSIAQCLGQRRDNTMKTKFHWVALALGTSWVAGTTVAQIVIGPQGSGILTFDAAPPVQEWATQSIGGDGGGGGIVTDSGLDEQVELVSATEITSRLAGTSILPPSQNNYARWNSAGGFLQTRIGN